jgi:putative acetyltransferase
MSLDPIIRVEEPWDFAAVFATHEAAFARPNEARLVELLRSGTHPRLSLVAELDSRVVGHVFFSPMRIESSRSAPPVGGLAPVGVLPELQRRGIGSTLIREGLHQCVDLGWRAVFLLGDPAYYSRFGFVLAAPLGVRYRHERFDPAFQVLELSLGALRGCEGWAHYHEAFDATGTG